MTTIGNPSDHSANLPSVNASSVEPAAQRELGRNEPCHCGSGKKFKRCHGVDAAPRLGAPKPAYDPSAIPAGMPGGFDPAKLDSQMMVQFSQLMARLPKGQLQKLQSIMQRAMRGEDVSREAQHLEKSLPVELQQLLVSLSGQMTGGPMAGAQMPINGDMSEEEARRIVAAAAKEGKISSTQAQDLLATTPVAQEKEARGLGRLWKGITGK